MVTAQSVGVPTTGIQGPPRSGAVPAEVSSTPGDVRDDAGAAARGHPACRRPYCPGRRVGVLPSPSDILPAPRPAGPPQRPPPRSLPARAWQTAHMRLLAPALGAV